MKNYRPTATNVAVFGVVLALAGCGGGGGGTTNSANATKPPPVINSPPSITGNPPGAVVIGESYSFTPAASDPDGDSLTFSIQNRPDWANFSATTGALTGVPSLGDTGTYSQISISVTDGQASDSLQQFAVTVAQAGTGSTTLSWTAPTQNEDGSPLTDLAGYTIYYGTASGNYTSQIPINNPGITTFVVDNLSPDTYYFAATASNSAGQQSRFSGEAVKTVN